MNTHWQLGRNRPGFKALIYCFLDCVVDVERHELFRAGQFIDAEPKIFEVLSVLLERHGSLATRAVLLERCWPGVYVSDGTLTRCLSRVRQAIGHGVDRRLIETVHRKGYRFIGDVSVLPDEARSPPNSQPTMSLGPAPGPDLAAGAERSGSSTLNLTEHAVAKESLSAGSSATQAPAMPPRTNSAPIHESPSSSSKSLDAERRQLTVLHCRHLVGDGWPGPDVEEVYEREHAFRMLLQGCLAAFEGHLGQAVHDDIVAHFGYPKAQSDSAQRAVLAGLRLFDRLQNHETLSTCQVQIGIHTGEVIVGVPATKGAQNPIIPGPSHAIAAWLCERAHAQCIVVSEATARLVDRFFECESLETNALSRSMQSITCYRVLRQHADENLDISSSNRRMTPFVGRDVELAWLRERWSAVQDGIGQAVLISGEAGVGKSRLVGHMRDDICGQAQAVWECRCSPYHRHSAFFPLSRLLRHALDADTENGTNDLGRIEALAERNHLAIDKAVPLLADLLAISLPERHAGHLSIDPRQKYHQTLSLLLNVLLNREKAEPSIIIIEDVHWADPSTLEWIGLLLNHVPANPVLLLLTCRSEFEPSWSNQAVIAPHKLDRLKQGEIEQMLRCLTGGMRLPSEAIRQVSAKTDGVPLFIEEFTQALLESGQLLETEEGYDLTWPINQLSVPLTLHESLMERLDKLSTGKIVAQWGAVLGRDFSQEVLTAASQLDEEKQRHGLAELLAAGLIYQHGLDAQARYVFKHALVRDVAYRSILGRQRQKIHRDVAKLLGARFPEIVAEQPELIAEHYAQAHRISAALPFWILAGKKAVEQGAHQEAIEHLINALDALQDMPDTQDRTLQELDIRVSLGPSLSASRGPAHTSVERCFERALSLCHRLDETRHLFPTLANLWRFNHSRARYRKAKHLAEQLLAEAERRNDAHKLQSAHQALGTSLVIMGELQKSSYHLEQSQSFADQLHTRHLDIRYSHDPNVLALAFLTLAQIFRGDPAQAIISGRQLFKLGEELQHPHSQVLAVHFCMYVYWYLGDFPKALQFNRRQRSLAVEYGFPHFVALGDVYGGWLAAKDGNDQEAVLRIEQGLADFKATGSLTGITINQATLADAYRMMGRFDAALATLDQTFDLIESTGERFAEAEVYRLKGELLLKHPKKNVHKAEASFLEALRIARSQQAKWWELRSATSLAELWLTQGKREQARQVLSTICGCFAEGINSTYVQRAKTLLAELKVQNSTSPTS